MEVKERKCRIRNKQKKTKADKYEKESEKKMNKQ